MQMRSSSQGRVLVRAYTIVALALLTALSLSPARAVTYTWDTAAGAGITPGPGTWGVNNFWTLDGTTLQGWVSGEDAVLNNTGATGANTVTVNATQNVNSITAIGSNSTIYKLTSGTINFTGAGGGLITVTNNLNLASNITSTSGTVAVNGANTAYLLTQGMYTGALNVSGATVRLDFQSGGVSGDNILGTTSTLNLSNGGRLTFVPKNNGASNQTVAGVTLGSGATVSASAINGTSNSGTLTLGTITRNAGSTGMTFGVGNATQAIKVSNVTSNGILGPWAMVGNEWATKDGNGNVVAYTGYTSYTGTQALASDSTANAKFNLSAAGTFTLSSATTSINTLLANSGSATTITIGSGQVLRTSGIYGLNSATLVNVSGSGVLTALSSANPELVVRQTGQNSSIAATIADVDPTTPTTLTKLGLGNLFLSAPGTFTGATYLNEGGIYTQNANVLQFSTLVMGGGNLNLTAAPVLGGLSAASAGTGYDIALTKNLTVGNNNSSTTYAAVLSSTSNLTKVGTGTLTLSGSNTYTGTTAISAGALRIGGAGQLVGTTGTYAGDVSVAAGSTFQYDSTAGSTLSGTVSGAGGLTQSGAGTLTLLGANTYGGATQVTGGVLALGVSNALSGSTAVTVAGGELRMGANSNTVGGLTITSGSLTGSGGKLTASTYGLGGGMVTANLGGGTLNVTANSALNGTSDATVVNLNAGALTLGSGGSRFTQANVAVSGSSGASLALGGNESFGSLNGAANVALGINRLSVDGNGNYSGVLSGSGGLTKIGSGKFTLSGSNIYTGSTIISAGTLALGAGGSLAGSQTIVAGNAGSSGAVLDLSVQAGVGNTFTFAAGQKVMGNGTIDLAGGTLRVPGMLAPGNSPGNLTINGNLAWQSSDAGYQWEINDATGIVGTNWDLLTVTGALDLTSLSGASTYLLDLTTLTSLNAAGPMANYVAGGSYTWSLVSASSVLLASGTAAAGTDITSLFNVSFANWANTAPSAGNYSVRVASDGQGINLVIVPEPNTIIFAGVGIAMAGWSLWKRRQK